MVKMNVKLKLHITKRLNEILLSENYARETIENKTSTSPLLASLRCSTTLHSHSATLRSGRITPANRFAPCSRSSKFCFAKLRLAFSLYASFAPAAYLRK